MDHSKQIENSNDAEATGQDDYEEKPENILNESETGDEESLRESLRVQKSEWIKAELKKQRDAEDAVLEQLMQEQKVIDQLNRDINENMNRTRENRKFNQEFQEKLNSQIYEMNGITEDKLKGIREYKNAYYRGCAFSLFLLSLVVIIICGVLHGFESQICLFMIACTGAQAALLAQDKWKSRVTGMLCKLLYLLIFPMMMVIFVCFELKYPEYDLFLPYCAIGVVAVLIVGTAAFFLYDPYRQDRKKVKSANDYIADVEKIAKKEVKKNQKLREKEEKKNLKLQQKEEKSNQLTMEKQEAARLKDLERQRKIEEREQKKLERKEKRDSCFRGIKEKWEAWIENRKEK